MPIVLIKYFIHVGLILYERKKTPQIDKKLNIKSEKSR